MQTIGERLEEARKRRGISLREASEVTKIRSEYLGNFESNTFELNIPEVYTRGFLRSYAQFLKLNADKIITDYNAHQLGESSFARPDNREFLGRLDITTADKADQAPNEAPRPAPVPANVTDTEADYGNFDKSALLKGGLAVAGAGVLVAVVIFIIFTVFRSGPDEPALATQTNDSAPVAQNQEITLIATGGDIANVTVTELSTGRELFRGPLSAGDSQRVPFDERVRLAYTHAEHLRLEHEGQQFQMGGTSVGRSTFPPSTP